MIYRKKNMVFDTKKYTPETHYEVMAWLYGPVEIIETPSRPAKGMTVGKLAAHPFRVSAGDWLIKYGIERQEVFACNPALLTDELEMFCYDGSPEDAARIVGATSAFMGEVTRFDDDDPMKFSIESLLMTGNPDGSWPEDQVEVLTGDYVLCSPDEPAVWAPKEFVDLAYEVVS